MAPRGSSIAGRRWRPSIGRRALQWSLAGICVAPGAHIGRVHPLHTTLTMLSLDARTGTATAEMRIFSDDLAKALAHGARARAQTEDSAALSYVRDRFTIAAADGHRAPLATCGLRASADLKWICLRTSLPGGFAGMRVSDAVLMDVYADQVNIVMANGASVLFVRGDQAKELR